MSEPAWLPPRYRDASPLGAGAFGETWRVVDCATDEPLALKLFYPGSTDRELRREFAVLRRLEIPRIPRLHEEGRTSRGAYVVMELIDGSPFPGPVPLPRCEPRALETLLAMTRSLLYTLHQVHGFDVVHGDLKPSNVLVDRDLVPYLLDFGCSAGPFTGVSSGGGTARYMAPEVLLGGAATVRSDLYSLGAMLYEAVVGAVPHDSDSLVAFAMARSTIWPAPPVPGPFGALIAALLAPEPADRPASAQEAAAPIEVDEPLPTSRPGVADLVGVERIFHVPSRAAAALAGAGSEWPRLWASWGRIGLVRRVPGAGRPSFEVDLRLVRHLEASPDTDTLAQREDAIRRLVDDGRAESAAELVSWALTRASDPFDIDRLTVLAVLVGFERGTVAGLEMGLLEIERSRRDLPELEALVRHGLEAHRGPAVALGADLLLFDDPDLAFWASAIRVIAARRLAPTRERALVEGLPPHPARVAESLQSWRAWLGYREARYGESARALADAARSRRRFADFASDLLMAASCAIEAEAYGAATTWVEEVREGCRSRVAPMFEARCEWLARVIAWRTHLADVPDSALVGAVDRLRMPPLTGQVALTEAAVAWAAGDTVAGALAGLASRRFAVAAMSVHEALASALSAATGAPTNRDPGWLLHVAVKCGLPRVGAQIAWLVGAAPRGPPEWRSVYIGLRAVVDPRLHDHRAEVLPCLPPISEEKRS